MEGRGGGGEGPTWCADAADTRGGRTGASERDLGGTATLGTDAARTLEPESEEQPVPLVQRVGNKSDQFHLYIPPYVGRGERPYGVTQFL